MYFLLYIAMLRVIWCGTAHDGWCGAEQRCVSCRLRIWARRRFVSDLFRAILVIVTELGCEELGVSANIF